ncbi:COQ9 family protein [Pseudosulfitobacter koreensis]|uniref:COQ9 family protein n=1 Tax=Pseudosulfitobacter koreensis TaxID=2968472 RepID=A0ABT1YVZ2_9RHOB|nr:COQ9 family protein [Pseudosulfitobacter koreense]MCR8825056.1 COQ9 family protein [Pseudosulfitobacter koreense]
MTELTVEDRLLQAIALHVPFDGWSARAFDAAVADSGVDKTVARAHYPRGAVDLALAFHARGDRAMIERLKSEDLSALRFRDRIAAAVRFRLEAVEDKEAVRRATTLFALPIHAADGAKAIWGTADAIWTALGDTSDDVNWYTKRATLSGVYGSTVLYWLGDDSTGHQATWAFLDRRIDNVMQIEKAKAQMRDNPVLSKLMAGPNRLIQSIRRPADRTGFPGRWSGPGN